MRKTPSKEISASAPGGGNAGQACRQGAQADKIGFDEKAGEPMKQMESVALSLLGKFRRIASGNGFTRDFRDDVSEICTYSGLRAKQHTVRVEFDAISDNMTLAGLAEKFGD